MNYRYGPISIWVIMLSISYSETTSGQSLPFSIPFHADTVNQLDSTGRKQAWWIEEITQRVPDTDTIETTVSLGRYADDVQTGTWLTYYKGNGVLASSKIFINGSATLWSEFDVNGRITMKDSVDLASDTHVYTTYFESGHISGVLFESSAKNSGTQYWENGNIERHWETSGKVSPDEPWVFMHYWEDGTIREREEFIGARIKHGTTTRYYRSGHLDYQCHYEFDKLNGEYKKYNEQGNLIEVMMWIDGVRHW